MYVETLIRTIYCCTLHMYFYYYNYNNDNNNNGGLGSVLWLCMPVLGTSLLLAPQVLQMYR